MKKIHILHIDDNLHDRILVKDAIEKENDEFDLIGVDNREKFEKHLVEGDIDLILSDFNILGFDGLQVLQLVKEKRPDIPVIVVTGTGSEEIAIEAMKMGASDYVIKSPSHIRGIGHTIRMVLEKKKLEDEHHKAVLAQMESETIYRSIFENTSVAILMSTTDGEMLSANGFACELFDMTEEEIRQAGRKGLIDSTDIRLLALTESWKKTGRAKGELTFLKKRGLKFQGELYLNVFLNKEGQERATMVIRDLTEQKEAEKQLKLLSIAIEQSPNTIIITDANGIIDFVNDKFVSVLQYSLKDVKGRNPRIFNPGHTPKEMYEAMWDTIHKGKVWRGEFENRKKDGTQFWENVIISPLIKNGGTIGNYIIIMEDITEKRKMLDDLIIAKEKAEESDHLKTAFLHNISHEIRTPMNAIVGFAGFLDEPDLLPEKRKLFTDVIIQSSNQLLSIITDIISIATIEAGQERVQENEINLNSLFQFLYDQFLVKAKHQKNNLDYKPQFSDAEAFILSDSTKLTGILNNLISNALKFTEYGSVEFSYTVNGEFLEFCVKDTGIGIPPEMHEEIFKRFRQVEYTAERKFGGAGLGLSISKSYVELLGGKIWLNSEPGKGSEFYFTIPYKKVPSRRFSLKPTIKELIPENLELKTILVAEDENTNFMLLATLLEVLELKIIRAENGLEAVDLCRTTPNISLILMDIKMPIMDGFEAARQIKQEFPDLPIIALTAFTSDADKKRAYDYGFIDFISKPIDRYELIPKIKKLLYK